MRTATTTTTFQPSLNLAHSTTPTQITSHTYHTHFHPPWTIGTVPHGGYVAVAILRAVSLHFRLTHAPLAQRHPLAIHLSYLRRTSVGPALITIRDAKLGQGTSTVHISLTQPEVDEHRGEEVVGYITFTNDEQQQHAGATFTTNWCLRPPPPRLLAGVECLNEGRGDANWVAGVELPFAGFRKASSRVRWAFPRARTEERGNRAVCNAAHAAESDGDGGDDGEGAGLRGYSDQWMALSTVDADGRYEKWTDDTLPFVCDMFPQIIEMLLAPGAYTPEESKAEAEKKAAPAAKFWYPTLLMNIEVKRSLGDGAEWLFSRVQAKEIRNGRYDLEVVVLDETGQLVALSQHVVFALPVSRNLKGRAGNEKGKL